MGKYLLLWMIVCFGLSHDLLQAVPKRYELTATQGQVNLSGKKTVDFALLVNGSLPAPTLYFTEGDEAEIVVRNQVPDQEISIHWHGILLPPEMDGVPYVNSPPIASGGSFTFRFKLRQSGTYWYHTHTNVQEQKGIYGAIVIQPKKIAIPVDHEAVVVISDWADEDALKILANLRKDGDYYLYKKKTMRSWVGAIQAGALATFLSNEWTRMGGMDYSDVGYDAFLINGAIESQLLQAKAGDRVRIRLVNAAASTYFHVALGQAPMRVIASDGVDLTPTLAQDLLIGMAETYDLLFVLPESKNYELKITAQDGTGAASAWIGKGDKVSAPVRPQPRLYESMDHSAHQGGGSMDHSQHQGHAAETMDHSAHEKKDAAVDQHSQHQGHAAATTDHSAHGMKGEAAGDHSQHKAQAVKSGDHSQHKVQAAKSGDHSQHKAQAAKAGDHSQHVADPGPAVDHNQHQAPEAESKAHDHHKEHQAAAAGSGDSKRHQGGVDHSQHHQQGAAAADHSTHHPEAAGSSAIIPSLTVDHLKALKPSAFAKDRPVHDVKLVLDGDMERYIWHINGKAMYQDRTIEIRPGEVVRFTLVNETMMHHPMHLHGHFFRVLNASGDSSPWKHTVDVPPHTTRTIEFLADEPGEWMLHCHNLYHMKTGMARVVKYSTYTPTPEMAALQKQDPHLHDHVYAYGMVEAATNHAQAQFRLSQTWNELDLRLETRKDYSWDLEGDLFYRRWMDKYLNVIVGGSSFDHETHAVVGLGYMLPFLIESTLLVNHEGRLRLDLEKRFQWTDTIFTEADLSLRQEHETEWEVSLMYANNWAWAAGLKFTAESTGVGVQYQF